MQTQNVILGEQARGLNFRAPVVVYNYSVINPNDRKVTASDAGTRIRDVAPVTDLPFIAMLNGRPLLRRFWDVRLQLNDILVFQVMPQGGGGGSNPLRAILQIALMVVVAVYAPQLAGTLLLETGAVLGSYSTYLAITQAALLLAGSALINAVVPLPKASGGAGGQDIGSPSPTYSVALQGNTARLEQPIPAAYGRNNLYCDFAAQPYTEYVDNEQFYYALFSIGQGEFDFETTKIDDTPISNFVDVEGPVIVPPGGTQTLVKTNILNAPEVSGQTLELNSPVGPFTVCGLGRKATAIIVDIVMPRGLYYANDDGTLGPKSIAWKVEARSINDFDLPITSWLTIGNETLTDATSSPIRKTYRYTVTAARYQVRLTRLDERDERSRAAHEITWEAMRAELNVPGVTNTTSTMMAIKIRASGQLSGLSQRRINVVVTRKLPVWNPTTGWSTSAVATKSIAWALADILRNPVYGEGRPDSKIDLEALYDLDQLWSSRGDFFNGVFDSRITVQDALLQVSRVGRATPIQRAGVMTFVRDGPQTLPAAIFNTRSIVKGSFQLEYVMRNENTADALDVEYWSERLWTWVLAPRILAPGVTSPVNPAKIRYFGATNEAHVLRDGRHIVADTAYRRVLVTFQTELNGRIPGFGDLIVVAHDLPGWATSGQVVSWDPVTNTAELSEPVSFTVGSTHYIRFEDAKGKPYGPYAVAPGVDDTHVVVIESLDTALEIYTGVHKDATRFIFGDSSNYGKEMRTLRVVPRGNDLVEIRAVVEDERVHTYETSGDPGDGGSGGGGGGGGGSGGTRSAYVMAVGTPLYPDASAALRNHGAWVANSINTVNGDAPYLVQIGA